MNTVGEFLPEGCLGVEIRRFFDYDSTINVAKFFSV